VLKEFEKAKTGFALGVGHLKCKPVFSHGISNGPKKGRP
jgi:hypothetical protein